MSVDIKIGEANASKIRFKVQHNQLASMKAGQARSVARVYANNRYNLQDLAGLLTQRGCLAKKTEVKYVLDSLAALMEDLLVGGNTIDLAGITVLSPTIRGTFAEGESFDPKKHSIVVHATAGSVLRGVAAKGETELIGEVTMPVIESIRNQKDYTNDLIYVGGVHNFCIKGRHLDFDGDSASEGLFISCPEYEGDDLSIEVIEATATEISGCVKGAIDNTYTAFITFASRCGDKNQEPIEIKREVTLKPTPAI